MVETVTDNTPQRQELERLESRRREPEAGNAASGIVAVPERQGGSPARQAHVEARASRIGVPGYLAFRGTPSRHGLTQHE